MDPDSRQSLPAPQQQMPSAHAPDRQEAVMPESVKATGKPSQQQKPDPQR
jgi:hypothetical protein